MERSESEITNVEPGNQPDSFGQPLPEESGMGSRVKSVASTVKQKASNLPALIADGLEAGANALRQNKLATASDTAATAPSDSTITAVTDTLATGMQSSADWIRDADIDKLKSGVEKQVKEHPARSLLVALGAGYLIGKAFRR
jgi:hypothetical protein